LERPNEIWRDLPSAFISRRRDADRVRRRRRHREPGDQSAAEFGTVAMPTGRRLAAAADRLLPLPRLLLTVLTMTYGGTVKDSLLTTVARCVQLLDNDRQIMAVIN